MKPASFHPLARIDIFTAATWYEERQAGLGPSFVAAVVACADTLFDRAYLPPMRGHEKRGVKVVGVGSRWPYRMILIERHADFVVLCVTHNRRRPDHWIERLDG